jgi:hypothetical protein
MGPAPLTPRAAAPDGDGVAAVGLAGVVPEASGLALLAAVLVEQAESGAAMATEAMSSVMDFEIFTARPFLAGGDWLGNAGQCLQQVIAQC